MLRILSQYVFSLIVVGNAFHCHGQKEDFSKLYKTGGTLYISAPDGLTLNDKAGLNGTKIRMISYGSLVLVQKDTQEQVVTSTDNIGGHWVKVKSDSAEGYVFDGYLSRWLPVGEREAGKSYFDKISRIRATDKKSPHASIRDYEKIIYENGVVYESKIFETGSVTSITIPQNVITLQETWLLATALFSNYRNTLCKYNPAGIRCTDGSSRVLNVKREGASLIIREEVKE